MQPLVETVIWGQDSYLSFYVKTLRDKKLITLTDDEQITRFSYFKILADGYVIITYYNKRKMDSCMSHHSEAWRNI